MSHLYKHPIEKAMTLPIPAGEKFKSKSIDGDLTTVVTVFCTFYTNLGSI